MDRSCIIAAGVAALLYVNTLDADFAYDDSRAIVKNPDLLPETPLANLLYDDFWGTPLTHSGSHKSYRPLCVLTFRLNYYLGGLVPWGYHLGNVLCHALTTAVFTHLAQRLLVQRIPTTVAGLLFASHPIHTEAVAGVVGRADVLACLFYLLTLLSYIRYVSYRDSQEGAMTKLRWRRWGHMALVVIFTSAAMLAKEQAIAVLAACATYDIFVRFKCPVWDVLNFSILTERYYRPLLEGLICIFACGTSLVGFRVHFMGSKPPEFAPSDNPASDSDSLLTRTLTFHYLPSVNVWLLLYPHRLSFDWSMEAIPLLQSVSDVRNVATVVFYLCLGGVSVYIWKSLPAFKLPTAEKVHSNGNGVLSSHLHSSRSPAAHHALPSCLQRKNSSSSTDSVDISRTLSSTRSLNVLVMSLSIIVFPFVPASNLFFYVGFVVAERILYIPSMGFCLLVAQGSHVLYQHCRERWQKRCVVGCLALVIVLFSLRTCTRNEDWQCEEKLYRAGIAVNPAKAWGNLANVLNDKGRFVEAEEAYRNALKYRGNMADVHYNLGILLQNQGRFEEAIESYKRAIAFRPKLTVAHLNLGILTAQTGSHEAAMQIYRHCADLDTSTLKDPRLHENTKVSCLYNLGRLFAEHNMLEEALSAYQEALKRRPSYYPAQSIQNMLGELYMKMNNVELAEHWYREALKSKPDHIPAHLTLAKLFQYKGMDEEAIAWFEKARALDPSDASVDHHQAQLYVTRGRHQEATEMYKLALRKNPNDFDIIFNAANAFRQINDKDMAEKLYRRAVEIKPKEPTAHMNLGAMLHMNGKLQDAEASYLVALKLRPSDSITLENLQKLRNLMASKAGTNR